MATEALLRKNPTPTEEEIKQGLSGKSLSMHRIQYDSPGGSGRKREAQVSGEGYTPTSLVHALKILAEEHVVPIAGGTDLMVRHRRGGPLPVRLVAAPLFIGNLPELRSIQQTESHLIVGAATTLSEMASNPLVPAGLKAALTEFAAPAIRNAGTIGGDVCNASPAGDTLPYLFAAGADIELVSASGERTLPLAEFIAPRLSNALSKLSIYAEAEFAVTGGQRCAASFRLAIGAVAPTTVRIPSAETRVEGATATELRDHAADIAEGYNAHIHPIDDQRSTAVYRRNTALTLIRHVIGQELPLSLEQS